MDPDHITTTLPDWPLTPVGGEDAGMLARIPEKWRPIALSIDAAFRRGTALALWNQSFLDLIPEFTRTLRTHCVDVRVLSVGDIPVLVYVLETDEDEPVFWVGYDPRTLKEPDFWDSFPEPVRVFLREVHAGFMSERDGSFGIARPTDMATLAERAGSPDGIPGWEHADISSTRLMQITSDGGILRYCLSPDLEAGKIALVYEGDIDSKEFGQELDELLMSRMEDPA